MLWGRHEGSRGGAPPAWVWGIWGRALSHPRPLVRSGVQPGPTTHWLWVRGMRARGPVSNPTARAHASWLCALWGRHEGAREGRLLPACGASGVGRSPTPDRSSVRACGRGPLPTGCGCGGCGRGDPSPTPQHALLRAGFARCGGGMRVPGGGASCLGVGRPGSGALPPPTTRPFGRAAGAHYPLAVDAGVAGVRTRHQPHSVHSCELALRAVGAARGCPGGGPLAWVWGVWDRRSPNPDLSSVRACARGPLPTGCGCGGCGHGDSSPTPQRALLRAGFPRCGGGMRVPGGGASCLGVGHPGSGALPPPTSVRSGVRPGPTTHWLRVRGVRAWGPVTNPTARALACCGGGMRMMRGGASCRGVGLPGSGARPPPTTCRFGPAAGAQHPLAVGAELRARGSVTNPTARSWELALRAVGAARGRPGGAPLAWVRGVRGRALSHPRPPVLSSVRPGPASHWPSVRCAGVQARLSLAPCLVPRFVVCCARFPGSAR